MNDGKNKSYFKCKLFKKIERERKSMSFKKPSNNLSEKERLVEELNGAFYRISRNYNLDVNINNITSALNFFRNYDNLSRADFLKKTPQICSGDFEKIYFFMHGDENKIKNFLRSNGYNLQEINLELYKQKISIGTKTMLNQFIKELESQLDELKSTQCNSGNANKPNI